MKAITNPITQYTPWLSACRHGDAPWETISTDELENTISIYSARPGEVIVSALQPVKDIRVFALNGSQVRRFSVNTTRYTFTLPAGIYLIQATDGERGQTEKVLVR